LTRPPSKAFKRSGRCIKTVRTRLSSLIRTVTGAFMARCYFSGRYVIPPLQARDRHICSCGQGALRQPAAAPRRQQNRCRHILPVIADLLSLVSGRILLSKPAPAGPTRDRRRMQGLMERTMPEPNSSGSTPSPIPRAPSCTPHVPETPAGKGNSATSGLGERLTAARLGWVGQRATECWYFANARNWASRGLHAALGFQDVTRDFWFPGVTFDGGESVLSRAARSGDFTPP
jgi:hypothetical protein